MTTYASGLHPTTSKTSIYLRHGNQYAVVTTSSGDPVEVYVIKRRPASRSMLATTTYNQPLGSLTYRQRITSERKIKDVLRNGIIVD
jgi:hypothetical protein